MASSKLKFTSLVWRGAFLGTSALVPGVPSASVAALLGIYPNLVQAIAQPRACWRWWIPVLWGASAGVLAGLGLIAWAASSVTSWDWVPEVLPILILATVLACGREVRQWSPRAVVALLNGVLVALVLAQFDGEAPAAWADLPALLTTGGLVSLSLLVPGISAMAVLYLTGGYHTLFEAVGWLVGKGDFRLIALLALGIGFFGGLVLFAKVLNRWIHQTHALIMAALTGYLVGALATVR